MPSPVSLEITQDHESWHSAVGTECGEDHLCEMRGWEEGKRMVVPIIWEVGYWRYYQQRQLNDQRLHKPVLCAIEHPSNSCDLNGWEPMRELNLRSKRDHCWLDKCGALIPFCKHLWTPFRVREEWQDADRHSSEKLTKNMIRMHTALYTTSLGDDFQCDHFSFLRGIITSGLVCLNSNWSTLTWIDFVSWSGSCGGSTSVGSSSSYGEDWDCRGEKSSAICLLDLFLRIDLWS